MKELEMLQLMLSCIRLTLKKITIIFSEIPVVA
jgi:hypothetical protein